MPKSASNIPGSLKKQGRFTYTQAKDAGLSQANITHFLKIKAIERIDRGIYEVVEKFLDPATRDFSVACLRFGGQSAIGGLSALFHYGLADEVPNQVWVLVPPSKYSTVKPYRLIRTKIDLSIGIETNHTYRITSLERTLVDAFIFASKIGEKIAYRAALRAIREKRTTPTKIFKMAAHLGVAKRLLDHSQALFGGIEA